MKKNDTYKTLKSTSEGIYKEKGSKFLAFAYPVLSEEMIREKVEILRKQYHDARHHCFAYILGVDHDQYRAYDDGEPNHSAGDPILGQLRSRDLTNTLVVVVRYFGGTKLGVSGLINAYKTAAASALDKNDIIDKKVMITFLIDFPYGQVNAVMHLVKVFDLEILEQHFMSTCQMKVAVRLKSAASLQSKLDLVPDLRIQQLA